VVHYTLDFTVNNVATSDLTAMVTIKQSDSNLGRFNRFHRFEIDEITVNGEAAEFHARDRN
jgi:hypothetical protein